jgi:hypothetical protein
MRETPRAAQAWADYLALGPDRSLAKLHAQYAARQKRGESTAPTTTLRQLEKWSAAFDWQGRLRALADQAAAAAADRQRAYIASIMESGFGLPHERVVALKTLASALLDELTGDEHRRWVSEPKQLGHGEDATIIRVERFNRAEVESLRGLLDDIAKETGGRIAKQQTEITGAGGGPLTIREVIVHMPTPDGDGE